MVTSNGARVLSQLGFSFASARAVKTDVWTVVHGDSLEPVTKVDLSKAEERFGAPVWAVHRVDLHQELLRLALDTAQPGTPARLHLAAEVAAASVDSSITLKDGSTHSADLIVAGDGLHSVLKGAVLEDQTKAPTPTGLSAFRFLIDTQKLRESPELSRVLDRKGPGATLLADTKETIKERHIMWYPCRKSAWPSFSGFRESC